MMEKCLRYSTVVMSFLIFSLGLIYASFNVILIGVLLMYVSNLIYAFENIKRRVLFLIFHLVLFVFLLSRPTISMIKGNIWWYFEYSSVYFALFALFLTIIFLQIGSIIMEWKLYTQKKYTKIKPAADPQKEEKKQRFIRCLQITSLCLFYIAIVFTFLRETEKFVFMRGKEYEQFYTDFESSLPFVFLKIAEMTKYFLCIFLATLPSKKRAVIPLGLYVLSAVPMLLIGARNPIVLNFLFALTYFFIRDVYQESEKWIGKFERLCLYIGIPVAMLSLGALNYIRAGESANKMGVFELLVDFLYKQGVSFDVLCIGHNSIPKIIDTGFVNYTFGPFIDYFVHGTIAQKLFGTLDFGSGNNIVVALYSNSFAHRMSYVSRGEEYLQGKGWGSSYILETYADFGYIGIIIFSIILAMLLIAFIPYIKKNWFLGTVILLSLNEVYFIPRDSALGWVANLLTVQFLMALVFCVALSGLMVKRYSYYKILKRKTKINIDSNSYIKERMQSNV